MSWYGRIFGIKHALFCYNNSVCACPDIFLHGTISTGFAPIHISNINRVIRGKPSVLFVKPMSVVFQCELKSHTNIIILKKYLFTAFSIHCSNYSNHLLWVGLHTRPHKPTPICNHQADSPFYLWPDVCYGDSPVATRVWPYTTQNVLTTARCHQTTQIYYFCLRHPSGLK